jgi:hypothetical protein
VVAVSFPSFPSRSFLSTRDLYLREEPWPVSFKFIVQIPYTLSLDGEKSSQLYLLLSNRPAVLAVC